eukprot:6178979-Pleurochrysis_carterae.AAC.3
MTSPSAPALRSGSLRDLHFETCALSRFTSRHVADASHSRVSAHPSLFIIPSPSASPLSSGWSDWAAPDAVRFACCDATLRSPLASSRSQAGAFMPSLPSRSLSRTHVHSCKRACHAHAYTRATRGAHMQVVAG